MSAKRKPALELTDQGRASKALKDAHDATAPRQADEGDEKKADHGGDSSGPLSLPSSIPSGQPTATRGSIGGAPHWQKRTARMSSGERDAPPKRALLPANRDNDDDEERQSQQPARLLSDCKRFGCCGGLCFIIGECQGAAKAAADEAARAAAKWRASAEAKVAKFLGDNWRDLAENAGAAAVLHLMAAGLSASQLQHVPKCDLMMNAVTAAIVKGCQPMRLGGGGGGGGGGESPQVRKPGLSPPTSPKVVSSNAADDKAPKIKLPRSRPVVSPRTSPKLASPAAADDDDDAPKASPKMVSPASELSAADDDDDIEMTPKEAKAN